MPNNNCENRLLSLLNAQEWHLDRLYAEYSRQFGSIFREFGGKVYKYHQKELDRVLNRFHDDLENTFAEQISNSFSISNLCNDERTKDYLKDLEVSSEKKAAFLKSNPNAVASFLSRKQAGLNLSDRVWKLTNQTEEALLSGLESGIFDGRPAADIARDLKRYLKEPDQRFRRIRNAEGKLVLSNPAKNYNPGQGVYRSSYKNALRLTRNEINIAYRSNDFERRKNMPWVMGQRIRLSAAHKIFDICDYMVGTYPKDYKFVGFHPNCYDKETEVYTNRGWIKFSEVSNEDQVLSLKKDKNLEWANVLFTIKKPYKGKMVHFHNRSLDMLVTPEHPMVYIPKSNTKVIYSNKNADEYDKFKGGLYRSSEYNSKGFQKITIEEEEFDFNMFCQFMGYYLSDGSCTRPYQIIISQREDNDTENYNKIDAFLKWSRLKYRSFDGGFCILNESLWNYLQDFGKCNEKYIPEEIKNSSPEQIGIFLDAFVSCDGYIKTNRSFTNSRGKLMKPKNKTRSFFTTSKRMADDIGELLLKIGKRPSFNLRECKGKDHTFKNGMYKLNYDLWTIYECHSKTATVFYKDYVDYNDFVYDVQLDRNHILLTRRNGKVVWGSNCLCISDSLLLPKEKFKDYLAGGSIDQRHLVKSVPKNALDYLNANADKINNWKSKPYFLKDNFTITKSGLITPNENIQS